MWKRNSQCEHGQPMEQNTRLVFAPANQVWLAVNHNTSGPLLANEFDVISVLLGQVSLAAVNQTWQSFIALTSLLRRESWLLCLICLPGVSWWLCGSSLRCHGVVCSLWLWYFLIILTYYFLYLSGGYEWLQKSKDSSKACFENVNIELFMDCLQNIWASHFQSIKSWFS